MRHALLVTALLSGLCACRTKRVLHVDSVPSGAVVRLDEDVIGVTPLEHEFIHGGQRRVSLYHEGYRTWSQRVDLELPWYSRFPFDIVTEVLVPVGLEHDFALNIPLVVDTGEVEDEVPAIDAYVGRALERRTQEHAAVLAEIEAAAEEGAAD